MRGRGFFLRVGGSPRVGRARVSGRGGGASSAVACLPPWRPSTGMRASPNLSAYRGPNHVLVTRRATRAALRARTQKLLSSRRWPAVHLHGLGAAIAPTIILAAELVAASEGQLVASCRTSTEVLIDHTADTTARSDMRHNSAVHVTLSSTKDTQNSLSQHEVRTKHGQGKGSRRR